MAIELFDFMTNRSRVAAGFKGGNFFEKPHPLPPLAVEECPPEVYQKFEAKETTSTTPGDPWVYKKPAGAGS